MSTRITGTIADIAMAKGKAAGKAEGKAEGIAEGIAKGEVKSRREDLLAILEERFGTLPPDLPGRLTALSDIEELRRAIRQAITIQKLEELQL
jgi:flagellar biosynthesis/type III secretory pathway protein FliH